MVSDLTVVIPTYNRNNFIKRSFNFWKDTGINFLICDSSTNINFELSKYGNYIYTKEKKFYQKLFETINLVKTKYVVIIADDDMVCINSLKECLTFLEQNETFVSAQGSFIDFWYNENSDIDICVRNPGSSGKNSNLIYPESNTRIYNSIKKYWHHIYSIHRKEILQQALSISKDLNNNPAAEINITIVGSIFGKHKMIENLYICRQIVPIEKINFAERETFVEWLNNIDNQNEINNWINKLATFHNNINKFSLEVSKLSISKAIYSYNKKNNGISGFIKSVIKFFIPSRILNIFRHPLYYKKSWPPTKQEALKIRNLSMNDKFYPWSNDVAKKQWLEINEFLNKYGKVEEKSFKI